ncbi:basic proline-rich protein-like [Rissa tridactyla]|uniref:basic proline-rich protein-like n=1 Tax=Rissa tridactyla TaxID=75485 RepID=UPI0023BA5C31|nr:basic proline-rich protein-like [Rissa tridactyla]
MVRGRRPQNYSNTNILRASKLQTAGESRLQLLSPSTPQPPGRCPSARDSIPPRTPPPRHQHPGLTDGFFPLTPGPCPRLTASHGPTPSVNTDGPRHSPGPSQYTCAAPARRPPPHPATGTPATFGPFPAQQGARPDGSPDPTGSGPACRAWAAGPPATTAPARPALAHRGRAHRPPLHRGGLGFPTVPPPCALPGSPTSRPYQRGPRLSFSPTAGRGGGRACAAPVRSPGTHTQQALPAAPPAPRSRPAPPASPHSGAQAPPLGAERSDSLLFQQRETSVVITAFGFSSSARARVPLILVRIRARSVALLGKEETNIEPSELLGDTNLLSAALFLGDSSLQHGRLAASNLLYIFGNYGTFRKLPHPAAEHGLQYMALSCQ